METETTTLQRPPKYRAPTHYAEAEFSLDDFSDEEIIEYVHQNNLLGAASFGSFSREELSRIDTLLLCGQREAVLSMVEDMLSFALGRNVKVKP